MKKTDYERLNINEIFVYAKSYAIFYLNLSYPGITDIIGIAGVKIDEIRDSR